MNRFLLLSLVVLATPGFAAGSKSKPRVAVLDFTGPHARTTRSHFANQVCHVVSCLRTGGDGSQVPADAVLVGEVKSNGKRGEVLEVNIISSADGRTVTRSWPLNKVGLIASPNAVGSAISSIVSKMTPKAPPVKKTSRVATTESKHG